jgi:hypothetical protein
MKTWLIFTLIVFVSGDFYIENFINAPTKPVDILANLKLTLGGKTIALL